MGTVNPNKTGLVLGALAGGWHVAWATLVAVGWAQWLLNFVFCLHFLKSPFVVQEFHVWMALILIAVTATIGYVVGYIVGVLWNWIHK